MKRLFLLAIFVAGPSLALDVTKRMVGASDSAGSGNPNFTAKEWVEQRVEPPAFPKDSELIEFHVSSNTANRFFIDASTLSVSDDDVVRYVMLIRTAGGATNITFEGMRCTSGEYKLYATGRADGTWAKSRIGDWRPIENKLANRHHAALSRDLFCPAGSRIANAADGRDALRRGKHPRAP